MDMEQWKTEILRLVPNANERQVIHLARALEAFKADLASVFHIQQRQLEKRPLGSTALTIFHKYRVARVNIPKWHGLTNREAEIADSLEVIRANYDRWDVDIQKTLSVYVRDRDHKDRQQFLDKFLQATTTSERVDFSESAAD